MLWLIFSLIGALSKSLNDLFCKKYMKNIDEYTMAWARFFFSVPYLWILVFFMGIPKIEPVFWIIVILAIPLEITAMVLYMKSIKASPLSLTIPMLGFSSIFILLTSFVTLRELPTTKGLFGILAVVIGTYFLGINADVNELKDADNTRDANNEKYTKNKRDANSAKTRSYRSFLEPLKSITMEKGALLMLIVAFIYSITPVMAKHGVLSSDGIFYPVIMVTLVSIALFPIAAKKSNGMTQTIKKHIWKFALVGLIFAAEEIFVFIALKWTLVNYVMSVKRTSIMFSVLFGYFFFRESNIKQRLIGSAIILAGIILISFA